MKKEAASNEFPALDDALGELEFGEIEIITKLEGDDDPLNWSLMARWMYTIIVVTISGIVGFSSSVYSPAISSIAESLHVSNLMSTLGLTTFLIGSAVGPLLFAPLSEIWGRNPLYYGSFLLFCLAILGCALAQNITTLLVCRFFAGLFGLPPVANTGGSITDLWPQSHRSVPLALYTAACFCAPVLGSLVGGFLTQNLSWRWTSWVVLIIATATYIIMVIALPETYAPRLLEIKNAKAGINTRKSVRNTPFTQSLMRPWIMLFTEPILISLSLYMAFIYGVLYLDFTAYPVVFQKARGWSIGISGLAFTGIGAGMAIATGFSPFVNNIYSHYTKKLGPVPEARLPHLIPIVWLLPIGIFWFGWTALPPTHWIVPIIAGVPFGFALVMLFLGINAYLTDCYDRFSASALAANTMLRCLFGAGFAVFATTMYEKLGTPWATSILGFVAVALGILPFVFYRFGAKLRAASKFHIYVTSHN